MPRVVEALCFESGLECDKQDSDYSKETQSVGKGDDVEERWAQDDTGE